MSIKEKIYMGFVGVAVLVTLVAMAHEWRECRAAGGVLVRGAFWLECVQEKR